MLHAVCGDGTFTLKVEQALNWDIWDRKFAAFFHHSLAKNSESLNNEVDWPRIDSFCDQTTFSHIADNRSHPPWGVLWHSPDTFFPHRNFFLFFTGFYWRNLELNGKVFVPLRDSMRMADAGRVVPLRSMVIEKASERLWSWTCCMIFDEIKS